VKKWVGGVGGRLLLGGEAVIWMESAHVLIVRRRGVIFCKRRDRGVLCPLNGGGSRGLQAPEYSASL